MPVTTIDFGSGSTVADVGAVEVHVRARWEDPWLPFIELQCVELSWACAPAMSTATLTYDYGRIVALGEKEFVDYVKESGLRRQFVRIKIPTAFSGAAWSYRNWYGVIEVDVDELGGARLSPPGQREENLATGRQTFTAHGMESLLQHQRVRSSFFLLNGTVEETGERIGFNLARLPGERKLRGNRTQAEHGGTYVFASNVAGANRWTTANIIDYLIERHPPHDNTGAAKVPFALASNVALPDWDWPELNVDEGATVYSLLCRLIDRRRLLVWWCEVDEEEDPAVVQIKIDSCVDTAVPIDIPGAVDLPANSQQLHLSFDQDPLSRATIRDTGVPQCDVVVARGGPELSVGTFSYPDGTIEEGWNATEQYEYEQAASSTTGYATANRKERQKRNKEARGRPEAARAFATFRIPHDWDQTVGDGLGGAAMQPLFPHPVFESQPIYLPTNTIRSTLPLLKGVDYSADAIANGVTEPLHEVEELETLVLFKRPDTDRWVRAEDMGTTADLEQRTGSLAGTVVTPPSSDELDTFSCWVRVPAESHTVEVRVSGAPQHVIAIGEWTPLDDDPVVVGGHSYADGMIITLCLPSGQRLEGWWPAAEPAGFDAVRIIEIDAGEHLDRIYVRPQTVVGISAEGALVRSTGGYIPAAGGSDDPEKQLIAIAKIAWCWYATERRELTLASQRLAKLASVWLGQFVTRIGHATRAGGHAAEINSVITEVRVTWPRGTPGSLPAPEVTWTTAAGELDPTQAGPLDAERLKRRREVLL